MRKLLAVCLALIGLTSCESELIHMFDKLEYYSFLRNESGKDVKVVMLKGTYAESTFDLPAGHELEIPDTDRWNLYVKSRPADTVWFEFADSTVLFHAYSSRNDTVTYVPSDNNIFACSSDGTGAWKRTRIRPQKYRLDYTIR